MRYKECEKISKSLGQPYKCAYITKQLYVSSEIKPFFPLSLCLQHTCQIGFISPYRPTYLHTTEIQDFFSFFCILIVKYIYIF